MKIILLFGPRKIGKSRFFNIISKRTTNENYTPSDFIRSYQIPETKIDLFDFPGKRDNFIANNFSQMASVGVTFYDINFNEEQNKLFHQFFDHFVENSPEDSIPFVVINKNDSTNIPETTNSNLAKLLQKGALFLDGNKSPEELLKQIISLIPND